MLIIHLRFFIRKPIFFARISIFLTCYKLGGDFLNIFLKLYLIVFFSYLSS